jgi:hypothetical protein
VAVAPAARCRTPARRARRAAPWIASRGYRRRWFRPTRFWRWCLGSTPPLGPSRCGFGCDVCERPASARLGPHKRLALWSCPVLRDRRPTKPQTAIAR